MIHAKIIDGANAFEALQTHWDQLALSGITNTPFQTLAYQSAWWKHLQPANSTLHTVAVYNEDSLIGIGCFYLLEKVFHFNACIEETDYLDIICHPKDAAAVWTAVFDCLCAASAPDWQALDFCNIPEASPSRTLIQKECE